MTNTPDTPNSPDPYGEHQPDTPNQAPPVQKAQYVPQLSLIHISEPTRLL